jgi:flagellar assembly factor FliW
MILSNTRFGEIEYSADDIISFSDGLIGFPSNTDFLLINPKPNTPFRWLQSIEEPSLAFLVAFTEAIVPNYAPEVDDRVANELDLDEETPQMLLTTVTIPAGNPQEMTTNLLGPIIINGATMKAKQVILTDDLYTVRHRVFATTERVTEKVAA